MKNNGFRFVRNERKVILAFILSVLLLGLWTSAIATEVINIPEATSQFYVNDFAKIFTETQRNEMAERAIKLAEQPEGIQVVVVTVKSLNGNDINDYATTMYNKYGIGKDDKGLLILLSTLDRDIWIEVGYGLESTFTDSKVGNYIDKYAMKYLRNNQFAEGLIALQGAFVSDLNKMYSASQIPDVQQDLHTVQIPDKQGAVQAKDEVMPEDVTETASDSSDVVSYIILAVLSVVIVIICGFVYQTLRVNSYKRRLEEERKHNDANTFALEDRNSDLTNTIESLRNKISIAESNYSILERQSEYQTECINELNANVKMRNQKISDLSAQVKSLENNLEDMTRQRNNLIFRFRHARQLYPDIDEKVDKSIQHERDEHDRLIAGNYDHEFGFLDTLEPGLDLERGKITDALRRYNELNEAQRGFLKTNIKKVRTLLDACNELHNRKEAEDFGMFVEKECSSVDHGNEENLERFKGLSSAFDRLNPSVKSFVNVAVMSTVTKLIKEGESAKKARIEAEEAEARRKAEEERKRREAEEERKRQEAERKRKKEEEERRRREAEEEERRRRRRMEEARRRSSSSSFSSSTHSHGFGGHSGGGGAGRHF